MTPDGMSKLTAAFSGKVWHHDITRLIVEEASPFALTGRRLLRRYPARLLRYFVPFHWLGRQAVRCGRPLRVCEIGIGRGAMPRFTMHGLRALGLEFSDMVERWIGVDVEVRHEQLAQLPYDELMEADIEKDGDRIPADCDVYILLHVLEHLHSPEALIRQLVPRLSPNAMILAGFPAHPHLAVRFWSWYLRTHTKANGHVSAMSNRRFTKAARAAGCTIEEVRAGYFMRASGLFLEDRLWWQKFNVAWGGLFPAWPSSSLIAARKEAVPPPGNRPA